MKIGSDDESRAESGFWARLASAFRAHETSSIDLLQSRIARLEKQVAQLSGAKEREQGVSGYARR